MGTNICNSYLWRRKWQPTLVLLPGESHGWRSLVGCSPWGGKELDTTERLHSLHTFITGEGNGNPLQCSCLENPMDRGTWLAMVHGVVESRTQLKWLSTAHIWQRTPLQCIEMSSIINNGLPRWRSGKDSACQCRRRRRWGFDPWVGKIPCRRKWQPTPVFLPRESHGQRSLAGCSPWGCRRVKHDLVTKQ